MKYIDLHCDTLSTAESGEDFYENNRHIDLLRLKKSGCLAQCFAVFIKESGNPDTEFEYLKKQYSFFRKLMKQFGDSINQAQNSNEILKNESEGRITAVLTAENGDFIGNDLSRIYAAAEMGIRIITLTWNDENCLGFPCGEKPGNNAKGLKDIGKQAVEIMNDADIIIDVSHLSEEGFRDVAVLSKKPFCASHSCCSCVFPHKRNLTDRQIYAIGESGGIIGINFYNRFINGGSSPTCAEDIALQAEKIINLAGEEAPAFGGDLDGIDGALKFKDCTGYIKIAEALNRKFAAETVDKICYKNALRLFSD